MTLPTFPTLAGFTFPFKRSPVWASQRQIAVSGREARQPLYSTPRYSYEAVFEFLRADANVEWQTLMGFYNLVNGGSKYFGFADPEDHTATNESLGVGNGVTTQFQLIRALGGFIDPIFLTVAAPVIKINNITTGAYTIDNYGLVTFTGAPANGATLTWSAEFLWLCRFDDDTMDFSRIYNQIWEAKKVAFTTEKP